ncbi:Aquaporin AQPAe.a [Ooceraea biroi]|uniref:Aquaporin AQPAe.a n=1 Tax=Ooceraea biroi TaxID=2015173 RepID=A0A026WE96_OOCBI|nr:Aquaporin AQPAe.a [Ooceraea biroi]
MRMKEFVGLEEVTRLDFLVSLFAEILGTFLLVLIGCASCITWVANMPPSVLHIAFTFGLAVASLAQEDEKREKTKEREREGAVYPTNTNDNHHTKVCISYRFHSQRVALFTLFSNTLYFEYFKVEAPFTSLKFCDSVSHLILLTLVP